MCCDLQVDPSITVSPAHPPPALRTITPGISYCGRNRAAQCLAKGRTWKMLGEKNENRENCLLFCLEKTASKRKWRHDSKGEWGSKRHWDACVSGVSKTTLKLLRSQMQLWRTTAKGSQLKSAKGKVHGAKTRREQVHAPKWCLPGELLGAMELSQQCHVTTGMKCCQPGKLIGVLVSRILTGVNHIGMQCLQSWLKLLRLQSKNRRPP